MSETEYITKKPVYHAGDKYACWKCDARLFEILKDTYAGDIMTPSHFQFIKGQKKDRNSYMDCVLCGNPWYNNGEINAKRVHETWN